MIRWSILATLALLVGCTRPPATKGVSLDDVLAFSNPAMCESAPDHARLLSAMIAGDANSGFRPGRIVAPRAVRSAFGTIEVRRHDGFWTVGTPVRAMLFGLPLRRIDHALPEGGDPGDVSYSFEAPIADVERALRSRGFPVEAGKVIAVGPPDGYEFNVSLLRDPDDPRRAILSCGFL